MSKNMNKRLFFVFLTNLSKVPRNQMLQVTCLFYQVNVLLLTRNSKQALLPQIKAVQAFKRSVKKKKEVSNLEKELQSLISKNASACAANKGDPQQDQCDGDPKKSRTPDDDIEDVNECKTLKKKKSSPMKYEDKKSKGENEESGRVAVAFQNSFGKLRRPNRTSNTSNKF